MIDDSNDQDRYSVCVASVDMGYDRRHFRFFRIADYDPEVPMELAPSLVEADMRTPEERRSHPNHLYDRRLIDWYDDRDSDFYMFRWGWGYDDRERPLADAVGVERFFKRGRELKEVIMPTGVSNEDELRRALRTGIPFEGRTTKVFYLVYGSDGPSLLAVKCDRNEFSFSGGLLRLPPKVTNVRSHALRAPRLRLDPEEIIEPTSATFISRKVYGVLDELESDGNVLLRLLDDYADDYLRWFINQEKVDLVTRVERQRVLRSVIESALDRPDALERYLEADVPMEDIEALKHAISMSASGEDDEARALIRSALLRDEEFRAECLEQVMAESTAELKKAEAKVNSATAEFNSVTEKVAIAESALAAATSERDSICEEINEKRDEIASLVKEKESALEELESNIALRLGLKAVSSSTRSIASKESDLHVVVGKNVERVIEANTLSDALAKNMARLGISCLVGEADEARSLCAVGIESALNVTNVLAIPMPVALPIANALSVSLSGKTAKRVKVPSDFRSIQELLEEVPSAGEVTIFENVIDPVNEGALFSLVGSGCDGVLILPFTSHASAELVAKEAWDRMFLPSTEALCLIPSPTRASGRMWRMKGPFVHTKLDSEDILDTVRELISELEGINLPNASFLLPGAVLTAFDSMPESENESHEPLSIISQHLGMVADLDGDSYGVLAEKSEGDIGLMQLARRLGKDAV